MKYITYDIAGRILKVGSAPDAAIDILQAHEIGTVLIVNQDTDCLDTTYYVDFVDGIATPVAMGQRPSQNHVFDYVAKTWIDPRTLADLKAQQWNLIKQARSIAEHAGFTWDGSTFDSDAVSQQRITGAVTLAQMNPGFTIGWTLADNTVRVLSAADMIAIGQALGLHVATIFGQAQALRNQIEAATTKEAVEAIVWS